MNLEEVAQKDYEVTKDNIEKAQKLFGTNEKASILIEPVIDKLDEFNNSWLKYSQDKTDMDILRKSLKLVLEAKIMSYNVLITAIESNSDLKKMKEDAFNDYKLAIDSIYEAEKIPGKFMERDRLVGEVREKLDAFNDLRQKYQFEKDPGLLKDSLNIALEAKLQSRDILERAKKCNPKIGINYVRILVGLVIIILFFYWFSHWWWNIPWLGGDLWYEIVFFSIFGALTNLTYSASLHVIQRDFDLNHEGWYWSKIPQAPLIALGVILLLRSISIEALGIPIDLGEAPNEVILAFAYFLGLFSRRTWKFLERISKWLIPVQESEMKM